jgi:hypothetical protein
VYYDQIQAFPDIPVPHFFDTSEYLYVGRLAVGQCAMGALPVPAISVWKQFNSWLQGHSVYLFWPEYRII